MRYFILEARDLSDDMDRMSKLSFIVSKMEEENRRSQLNAIHGADAEENVVSV